MVAGSLVVHARSESSCSAIVGAIRGTFLPLGLVLPCGEPRPGKTSDGHCLISSGDLVIPYRDVTTVGHSPGEVPMSRGHLASWVEGLAMACDERGTWAPYIGELWDALLVGSPESAPL
jgi:hypothetical protein